MADLNSALEAAISGIQGDFAWHIEDPSTGRAWTRNAHEAYPAASTLKVAVFLRLLQLVDDGRVGLDHQIRLRRWHQVGGAGVLQYFSPETSLTVGEVGLDNQLLSGATESSALVANACVCCTGLPGLAEALEDLFWARLERRMPRFPNLVIETTGLAEPGPVAQALASSDLLKERYRLAGVITCLSASTADAVLKQHAEARAQLAGADVLILTKTDLKWHF